MNSARYEITSIGHVESPLRDRSQAPRQGDEGAPDAWLVLDGAVRGAARDLQPGDHIVVLTWLDRADRDTVAVHPRGDAARPPLGVFSTRSPERPNPIGLHDVQIIAVDGDRIQVRNLEALDDTPIVDIKPKLGPLSAR
jgi:tRNA-Thr(GGU) m(6)t(6)A37 methyltransferase TsaA